MIEKLKLITYIYEPINKDTFLYISNGNVSIIKNNQKIETSLEEVSTIIDQNYIKYIDNTLIIEALHHKTLADEILNSVKLNWSNLLDIEKDFKSSFATSIKNFTKPKLYLVK